MRIPCAAAVAAVLLLAHVPVSAQGALPTGSPPPGGGMMMGKTYEVQVQLEASANLYHPYGTQGTTWHHGLGFVAPFGYAEYYCGHDFPEEAKFPLTEWQKGFFNAYTGRADALFCLYTTKDGTFYVRDSVAGQVYNDTDSEGNGASRNMMINLVVGGTGPYAGATGIWTGYTEGRGKAETVGSRRLPTVLLKVMTGYVKLPNAK